MSHEKKRRNQSIKKLHAKNGGPYSYREIQKIYKFKSVKTVFDIVNRSPE